MPRKKGGKAGAAEDRKSKGTMSRKRKSMASPTSADDDDDAELQSLGVPLDAVVKVWTVHSFPNFSLPWQRRRQERSSGSGFCVDLERKVILTNAHCVEWHAQVKVQRRGDDTKYIATVLAIGWECDAAVLTVEDKDFWQSMQAVELCSKLPHLEEPVLCVGFPVGGDTISVTSGVISRIEVTTYSEGNAELLGIQIDAAINSGNSGGPAFNDAGQCVGVAFQSLGADEAENVGYIIPTVVVMHFLNDLLKHGKYTGFPTLGIEVQNMENVQLRDSFGMDAKEKGVLVRRVAPTSSAAKVLKEMDVLLAFEGEQIGNDGTVRFRKHERVMFSWLVAQKFFGEEAKLTVLRGGERLELMIDDLQPAWPLVPEHFFHTSHPQPSYLIVAGLVFTTLSVPFLRAEFGEEEWESNAHPELVKRTLEQRASFHGQQLVILSQVLANELTVGYETMENVLLTSINGTEVNSLQHLHELIDSCREEYLRFSLYSNLSLILKSKPAREATAAVLEKHGIPAAMSRDLMKEPQAE